MAFYPCERCGQPYIQAQQTMYPALLDGATDPRMRRRLCPRCFNAMEAWCDANLTCIRIGDQMADADDQLATFACIESGCTEEARAAIFVTAYPRKRERRDYFGRVCERHDASARVALFAVQEPLPLDSEPDARTAAKGPRKA